ncbi:carbohydrate sulfotransferase 11 [Nasonia vitripennis]|uniref:Carbohydrate sulfotransferase n=1 Tax=Nasonia vitripennis TaxID=7425 RepID=A0A7M7G4T5_NASVI|nr:carbohydrate sulfotransferase 11 [Nasonia vitripennis]XP_031780815.1 carbohydrate sulfotransferase 11 [Nasonia vitripennis]
MKAWTVTIVAICALLWFVAVCAQEVWSVIGNGDDAEEIEPDESLYAWSRSNALARSTLLDRQERLQYKCDQMSRGRSLEPIQDPAEFRNLLVDEKHKLLYCYVPKVACTNWKRVLMIATGKWKGNSPMEIPADLAHASGTFLRLSNFTIPEIEEKLAAYNKLIVVRHPFERLLSAYRNKFEAKRERSSAYFQSRFGRKIIKKFRPNATKESLLKGDDVTFGEFVDFVTKSNEYGTRNEHWNSISELCHPCLVNYNLISKYETLVEDATEILERIDVDSIPFPVRPQNSQPTSTILDKYYSSLTLSQLRDLAELYRSDLYLFDYSLEQILGFSIA